MLNDFYMVRNCTNRLMDILYTLCALCIAQYVSRPTNSRGECNSAFGVQYTYTYFFCVYVCYDMLMESWFR